MSGQLAVVVEAEAVGVRDLAERALLGDPRAVVAQEERRARRPVGVHVRARQLAEMMPWTFFDRIQTMLTDPQALPSIARLIGFRPVAAERGTVTMELDVDGRLLNAVGTLHGGVLCDVTDAAMGLSYATTLAEGESPRSS